MTRKPAQTDRPNGKLEPAALRDGDLEQVSGGSQSTGAGKITFNPFSITRKVDASSPTF